MLADEKEIVFTLSDQLYESQHNVDSFHSLLSIDDPDLDNDELEEVYSVQYKAIQSYEDAFQGYCEDLTEEIHDLDKIRRRFINEYAQNLRMDSLSHLADLYSLLCAKYHTGDDIYNGHSDFFPTYPKEQSFLNTFRKNLQEDVNEFKRISLKGFSHLKNAFYIIQPQDEDTSKWNILKNINDHLNCLVDPAWNAEQRKTDIFFIHELYARTLFVLTTEFDFHTGIFWSHESSQRSHMQKTTIEAISSKIIFLNNGLDDRFNDENLSHKDSISVCDTIENIKKLESKSLRPH